MNKSGIGIGSASIVLVFAVLCLTVFAVISLSQAQAEKAMADAEARNVKGYYEADTLAEYILAELAETDTLPRTVRGIDIFSQWDEDLIAEVAEFSCPIGGGGQRELYVRVAFFEASYDVLEWRMRDTGVWEIDDSITVWPG